MRSFAVWAMSVLVSLVVASSAGAEPIYFEEAWIPPSGDFPDSGSGYPVGTLDVGVNIVVGNTLGGLNLDNDRISFELPDGLLITGIELSVSYFQNEGDGSSGIGLLSPSSGSESFDGVGTVDIDPFTIIGSTIGFGLWPGVDSEPINPIWFDAYTYRLSVTVEEFIEIPALQPTALFGLASLLFGSGLVGIAAGRRRKMR